MDRLPLIQDVKRENQAFSLLNCFWNYSVLQSDILLFDHLFLHRTIQLPE